MADNTERFLRATDLMSAGRLAEAGALFREILQSQPQHLAAATALAEIVESGAVAGDADAARRRARQIEAEATYNVGRTALVHGRFDVATRCYRKVLDLVPDHDDATWGLAEAYNAKDAIEEAVAMYRRYLERHPGDAEARHIIAALGDGPKPPRASDAYVRDLFDHFAADFDRQLLEDLNYKAPVLLFDLCREALSPREASLDILDAGCGTGLAGIEFRPLARTLAGVDLSPEMLKIAAGRNIYDELVQEELSACFRARPGRFDLIVAADVLCYVGDLSGTLAAAAEALRPDGCLAFSVECGRGPGYVLTRSGRYAHAPDYVRDAAAAAGFEEIRSRTAALRTEYGAPVEGYLTVLRKGPPRPAATPVRAAV